MQKMHKDADDEGYEGYDDTMHKDGDGDKIRGMIRMGIRYGGWISAIDAKSK